MDVGVHHLKTWYDTAMSAVDMYISHLAMRLRFEDVHERGG